MTLRPYQQAAADDAVRFLNTAPPGAKRLYAAPTGTGKSYIATEIKKNLDRCYVVSPSDDILRGFAEKEGLSARGKKLEAHGYWTPVRLQNCLARGTADPPNFLVVDEAHHYEAKTYKIIEALCGETPTVGLTATPYRGTARSTAKLRETWGPPRWIITLPEAVHHGYCAFPNCSIIPLLDDDVVSVVNGEFVVTELEQQTQDCYDRLLAMIRGYKAGHKYDRPTMLSFPGVDSAEWYAKHLTSDGCPAVAVTGTTPPEERVGAFKAVLAGDAILCQVRVVSEGVDLPLRRLVDLSPTLSPVKWLQQFGRITRPSDEPPEYICTNRNLLRHAYLLEGLLPPAVYSAGEAAFVKPSQRDLVRSIGFEGLGKFAVTAVPLHNGTTGQLVAISRNDNGVVTEFAAVASPLHGDVLYAKRVRVGYDDARWERIAGIPDIETGYASVYKGDLTEKQLAWWKRSARWYGLDPEAKVNTRAFSALPILKNCGFRFR